MKKITETTFYLDDEPNQSGLKRFISIVKTETVEQAEEVSTRDCPFCGEKLYDGYFRDDQYERSNLYECERCGFRVTIGEKRCCRI